MDKVLHKLHAYKTRQYLVLNLKPLLETPRITWSNLKKWLCNRHLWGSIVVPQVTKAKMKVIRNNQLALFLQHNEFRAIPLLSLLRVQERGRHWILLQSSWQVREVPVITHIPTPKMKIRIVPMRVEELCKAVQRTSSVESLGQLLHKSHRDHRTAVNVEESKHH